MIRNIFFIFFSGIQTIMYASSRYSQTEFGKLKQLYDMHCYYLIK